MEFNKFDRLGIVYGSGNDHASLPEAELWTRVIVQAIDDLDGGQSLRSTSAQESARRWFASDYDGVGSFVWSCNAINVDPNFIRSRLAKKYRITVVISSCDRLKRSRVEEASSQLPYNLDRAGFSG